MSTSNENDGVFRRILGRHSVDAPAPFGSDKTASYALANDLGLSGYPARVLRCTGFDGNGSLSDPRQYVFGPETEWVHHVVLLSDRVYGLAAGRFDRTAPGLEVKSMAEFAGRWNLVAQDRDWSPKKPDGDSEDGLASSPTF